MKRRNCFRRISVWLLSAAMLASTGSYAYADEAADVPGISAETVNSGNALSESSMASASNYPETAENRGNAAADDEAESGETDSLAYDMILQNSGTATPSDYSGYDPGVTVIEDGDSPTGYTGVFLYDEAAAGFAGLQKVELYSDCMMLTNSDEQPEIGKLDTSVMHAPQNYTKELYPAGGNAASTYYAEMQKLDGSLWGAKVPLSSGAFVYNFRVTTADGTVKGRLDDPSNPTLTNSSTGIHSLSSLVYVPYNEDKTGSGEWNDRSVELPAPESSRGEVDTIAYTGAAGDERRLAVYLPAGYDPARVEPYKVLYLSHGASGDRVGNELRWMNEGTVANIMDNLIADGSIEPFVVVTMNNQDLTWDQDKIWAEQQLIMAEAEQKYNICTSADGRAFAGLSMGGITTSTMYKNHADEFSYFGIWSASASLSADEAAALKDKNVNLMLAAGEWDFGYDSVNKFGEQLTAAGIPFEGVRILTVPGAHDWETWQLIYAYAAENFFWKADKDSFDYSRYEKGVTVVADDSSPTGYNVIFIADENDFEPATYGLRDIAKMQVYSDGMFLFSYDEQTAGAPLNPGTVDTATGMLQNAANAHNPSEFKPGMYPAGGDTSSNLYGDKKIAYYQDMTEFSSGMWGTVIPLTSGATYYNYRLTDSDGKRDSKYIDDPANPVMTNSVSGAKSRSSMVYVPYDEKQGTGEYADRSVENPRQDGHTGKLVFDSYTGAAGDERYLGIYLPYGFDASRAKPYKVLYLSHGMQSESRGCELRWLNECAAVNILDNMNADYILVTMNNTDMDNWNIDRIWAEQKLIMAHMESRYNAGHDASDRAYAGLSMGGITASRIYAKHAADFSYIGIWSAADVNVLNTLTEEEKTALKNSGCRLSLSAGDWDYLLFLVQQYGEQLKSLNIDYHYFTAPGSHDWRVWQAILAKTADDIFSKDGRYIELTFDANGVKFADESTVKVLNAAAGETVSVESPGRRGYIFAGWTAAADGSGESFVPGQTAAGKNMHLYAKWWRNSSGGSGSGGSSSSGGSSYSGSSSSHSGSGGSSGSWRRDEKGWWLRMPDGSYPFSAWKQLKGLWYYFNSEEYAVTGWQMINGRWYCFSNQVGAPLGSMLADTITPDGYRVGADGAYIE